MINKYNKIVSIILILITLIIMFIFVIAPKNSYSYKENRNLQKFPSLSFNKLSNGTYFEELNNYVRDLFPFRDNFTYLKTNTEQILGKNEINNVYISKDNYLLDKYNEFNYSDFFIKYYNNMSLEFNYINMNLMLIPSSITVNKDLLPKNVPIYDEIKKINYIYDRIHFDTIDLYDVFIKHNSDYNMYYKYDNHITTYASYYAYNEYASHNNIKAYSLNSFDVKEVTNSFNGNLYSKANYYTKDKDSIYRFDLSNTNYTVKYKNKEINLYDESYLSKKDKLSYFLGNKKDLIEITNNNIDSDKELLVIKDDDANSIIPFLINHYKKIYVIDEKTYSGDVSEYIRNNKKITDCLIVYGMNFINELYIKV